MARKKLTHHVTKELEWKFSQVNLKSKGIKCPGTSCTHQEPIVHLHLTGYCGKYADEASHVRCPVTISSNLGGKKPVVCSCLCHQGRAKQVAFGFTQSPSPQQVTASKVLPSAVKRSRAARKTKEV